MRIHGGNRGGYQTGCRKPVFKNQMAWLDAHASLHQHDISMGLACTEIQHANQQHAVPQEMAPCTAVGAHQPLAGYNGANVDADIMQPAIGCAHLDSPGGGVGVATRWCCSCACPFIPGADAYAGAPMMTASAYGVLPCAVKLLPLGPIPALGPTRRISE